MILSLTLKCFRKHEDTHIDFITGLNTLRGANESGKSTIIEALLYALYGATALRDSLAECVTWGRKESELKVKALIRISGTEYTFSRSKSGAECSYKGADGSPQLVTGHKEVTAFAGQLLGADAKTASSLMLATQSNLRGALDDGPAAVSGLMGKLADFDLIDKLLDSAQSRLLLGSAVPLNQKIVEAEKELEELVVPDEDLAAGHEEVRKNFEEQMIFIAEEIRVKWQPASDEAGRAYSDACSVDSTRDSKKKEIEEAQGKINKLLKDITDQRLIADARPHHDDIVEARDKLAELTKLQAQGGLYAKVANQPPYPEVFWEGTKEDFEGELKLAADRFAESSAALKEWETKARTIRAQKITSGKCPTCGHAARSDEHVRQHNDEIERRASACDVSAADVREVLRGRKEDLEALEALKRVARPFEGLADQLRNIPNVVIHDGVYPPRIEWVGEVPSKVDTKPAKDALDALTRKQEAAARASGHIVSMQSQVQELTEKIARLTGEIDALPTFDTAKLFEVYNAARRQVEELQTRIEDLKLHEAVARRQRDEAQKAYEIAVARRDAAQKKLTEAREDLKTLEFNNALVAKLKRIKPAITDYLWNTVLAAVSNFFSQLRGEDSVVTKEPTGFKVNGRNIESLSGSTIDALALAVRVALTKTFIPHASFIVLDEPAHGADQDRTGNILGFLAGVGFQQTLLASHDVLSESVADNIIAL